MEIEAQARITILCGHYGAGKTNLAMNLALAAAHAGQRVAVADLDLVNPYFRTADFAKLLAAHGIRLIAPQFANTNLDMPVLPPDLGSAIADPGLTLIIDVGGDDDGAVALGGYAAKLTDAGYQLLYVVNRSRYLEDAMEEELALLRSVERCSRLTVTGLVNTTNLGSETTAELLLASQPYLRELSESSGIPLRFTVAEQSLCPDLNEIPKLLPVKVYVKAPWDAE